MRSLTEATGVEMGRDVSVKDMLGLRLDFSVRVIGGALLGAGSDPGAGSRVAPDFGGSGCGGCESLGSVYCRCC